MQFTSAKQILLILGAHRGSHPRNAEKPEVEPQLRTSRLSVFMTRISILHRFISDHISRILLTIVIAFFLIQILAGALTVLRGKSHHAHKRYGFTSPLDKISGPEGFQHRRFSASNIAQKSPAVPCRSMARQNQA